MAYVMRVGFKILSEPDSYVRDYDLDVYPTGRVWFTEDIREAKRFPNLQAVMEAWREPSQAVPMRPDGERNRPLTAFTMTFVTTTDD